MFWNIYVRLSYEMYLGTTLKLLTKPLVSCVPQGPQEARGPGQAWPLPPREGSSCSLAGLLPCAPAPQSTPGLATKLGCLPRPATKRRAWLSRKPFAHAHTPTPRPRGLLASPGPLREGWGWDAGGTKTLEQNRTPGKGAHLQGLLEAWNPVSHLRPGPTGSAA